MDTVFGEKLLSNPFTFYIGPEKTSFIVHSACLGAQSQALFKLMNGNMVEANSRSADLEDVDRDTFIRFCEFAYTGDYTAPEFHKVSQQNDETVIAIAENELEDFKGFGQFRRKGRKSKKFASGDWGVNLEEMADESYEPPRRMNPNLQNLLSERDYPRPSSQKQHSSYHDTSQMQDSTSVSLGHARLYVFADKYGVQTLQELALYKLYKTLLSFTLHESQIDDVMQLVKFAYENTPTRENTVDGLRRLITHYVAQNLDKISNTESFKIILEEGGRFVRDFWEVIYSRAIK